MAKKEKKDGIADMIGYAIGLGLGGFLLSLLPALFIYVGVTKGEPFLGMDVKTFIIVFTIIAVAVMLLFKSLSKWRRIKKKAAAVQAYKSEVSYSPLITAAVVALFLLVTVPFGVSMLSVNIEMPNSVIFVLDAFSGMLRLSNLGGVQPVSVYSYLCAAVIIGVPLLIVVLGVRWQRRKLSVAVDRNKNELRWAEKKSKTAIDLREYACFDGHYNMLHMFPPLRDYMNKKPVYALDCSPLSDPSALIESAVSASRQANLLKEAEGFIGEYLQSVSSSKIFTFLSKEALTFVNNNIRTFSDDDYERYSDAKSSARRELNESIEDYVAMPLISERSFVANLTNRANMMQDSIDSAADTLNRFHKLQESGASLLKGYVPDHLLEPYFKSNIIFKNYIYDTLAGVPREPGTLFPENLGDYEDKIPAEIKKEFSQKLEASQQICVSVINSIPSSRYARVNYLKAVREYNAVYGNNPSSEALKKEKAFLTGHVVKSVLTDLPFYEIWGVVKGFTEKLDTL